MNNGKNIIKILVAGSAAKSGRFLETMHSVPGIKVACVLDAKVDAEGLALARELELPVAMRLSDLGDLDRLDMAVDLGGDKGVSRELARAFSGKAPVLAGKGARVMRILTALHRKKQGYEERFRSVKREMDEYLQRDDRIVGKSDQIREVQDLIARVAPTPTTVLLLGETGTGKDLAARSIHSASPYKNKPFISVNCTALTSSLMESELFGYKKGAFTGADEDRRGLLEEADGGTLFLDEIGDMQIELQAKMLRFLQTGEVRRVGSTRTRQVKVRVIAATNRDLEQAIENENFRRDLYYRFNTFSIKLAPLRERSVDIPYLAYHFLTKAEGKLNKKVSGISEDALSMMSNYEWPGNIRELSNVIERAVILCNGGDICPCDLPQQMSRSCPAPESRKNGQGAKGGFNSEKERIMANFEKKELLHYINKAEGNISKASRLSGIPRRTFYRKLRKYGL